MKFGHVDIQAFPQIESLVTHLALERLVLLVGIVFVAFRVDSVESLG